MNRKVISKPCNISRMETSNSPDSRTSSRAGSTPASPTSRDPISLSSSRSYGIQFPPALRYLHSPLSSLLEHSGLLRVRPDHSEADPLIFGSSNSDSNFNTNGAVSSSTTAGRSSNASTAGSNATSLSSSNGEVSIRIIGPGEGDRGGSDDGDNDSESAAGVVDGVGQARGLDGAAVAGDSPTDGNGSNGSNRGESSYQRYDIQQFARWVEQILPFSLLLLVVFLGPIKANNASEIRQG